MYRLDRQHDGYRYDPRRTGTPPRPGQGTHPDGDYCLPVWGPALLTAVEGELTGLLGGPIRRRNQNNPGPSPA
ncbi:DUF2716 domain-containing protein [Streptomyces yangpuensis]|uniref:DUF2716 domain-containing protein n=1 Tax=Streptomyces yangpuensis TaxID=1648182 RepID=UPI00341F50A3